MRIEIDKLFKIANLDQYGFRFDKSDPATSQAFALTKGKIEDLHVVTVEYLKAAQAKGVRYVSIVIPKDLLVQDLRPKYPDVFPPPEYSKQFSEVRAEFESMQIINTKSKRIRKMYLWEDITAYNPIRDVTGIVASGGAEITATMLAGIAKTTAIQGNPIVDYRESESGALVFVPGVKNIAVKIDIIAALAELNFEITEIANFEEAFQFYREKQPKIVIIGKITTEITSKELYLYIDEYDPFARIINYDESPAGNRVAEGRRIKAIYDHSYKAMLQEREAEEERAKTIPKKALSEEQKKQFMLMIKKIQDTGSVREYINTQFIIRQLSKTHDVRSIEIMLRRTRKLLPMPQLD